MDSYSRKREVEKEPTAKQKRDAAKIAAEIIAQHLETLRGSKESRVTECVLLSVETIDEAIAALRRAAEVIR